MVTAGVYMVARCGAIFSASETAMTIVAVIGAVTALFAATIALVQTDMKRILAYSTISQLGYMFLALGVYAADSAIFHLFTHAFFKALLFLGAGSVMHAMGGVIDVRHFSGLRRVLPWTYATFVIGSLALAGFPMFSGFFSKDEIIHHALAAHPVLGGMALLTAALTAFYTFRMVFLAFHGSTRVPEGVHPHESGGWMIAPLCVLSIGAVAAGYVGVEATGRAFHHFLSPVFSTTFTAAHSTTAAAHATFWSEYGLMVFSGGLSIAAIVAAYIVYVRQPWIPGLVKASAMGVYRLLWGKYHLDELYDLSVVQPARQTGRICVGIDDYVVDGLLWVVTALPRGIAYLLRVMQSGLLQGYALSMVAGIVVLLLLAL
jgi:NADH-quinone oxidoreductase subunit L